MEIVVASVAFVVASGLIGYSVNKAAETKGKYLLATHESILAQREYIAFLQRRVAEYEGENVAQFPEWEEEE